MWSLLPKPRSLIECYSIASLLLRASGLFPYYYDLNDFQFHFSWKIFLLTVLHTTLYTYVNITFLLTDWRDYAQPLIGHSILGAIGNLVLRLLGIAITFLILGPVLMGSRKFLTLLNIYATLVQQCHALGIDVMKIYGRIYIYSLLVSIGQMGLISFNSWHSVFFYQRITGREPTLKYYVVVVMSNFYKMMFLYYMCIQLMTVYVLSSEVNKFLDDLVRKEKEKKSVKAVPLAWAMKKNEGVEQA